MAIADHIAYMQQYDRLKHQV